MGKYFTIWMGWFRYFKYPFISNYIPYSYRFPSYYCYFPCLLHAFAPLFLSFRESSVTAVTIQARHTRSSPPSGVGSCYELSLFSQVQLFETHLLQVELIWNNQFPEDVDFSFPVNRMPPQFQSLKVGSNSPARKDTIWSQWARFEERNCFLQVGFHPCVSHFSWYYFCRWSSSLWRYPGVHSFCKKKQIIIVSTLVVVAAILCVLSPHLHCRSCSCLSELDLSG